MSFPVDLVVSVNGAAAAAFTVNAQAVSASFLTIRGGYVAAEHAKLKPDRADDSLSGAEFAGETWRDGYPLRKRLRPDKCAGRQRIDHPVGDSVFTARRPNRRYRGQRTICRPGVSRRIPDQRGHPASLPNGDQPITATIGGDSTQPGVLITVHNWNVPQGRRSNAHTV